MDVDVKGFPYRGRLVTLANFRSIFDGVPEEILDEVRLAALDGTPIGDYIYTNAGNVLQASRCLASYRRALRDGVPLEYLPMDLTDFELIDCVRSVYNKVGSTGLDALKPYYCCEISNRLDGKQFSQLCVGVLNGVDLSSVDFRRVQAENIPLVLAGLQRGYPMWRCAEKSLSYETMLLLVKGMAVGVDIYPFTSGEWDNAVLTLLFSKAKHPDFQKLLQHITPSFPEGCVKELLTAMEDGLDYAVLCETDDEGYPMYNEYQMAVLLDGLRAGKDISELLFPDLSDIDMRNRLLGTDPV